MTTAAALRSFRQLAYLQLTMGLIFALLLGGLVDVRLGASFALGALLMLTNVLLLGWTWWRLIAKKSIAWTTMIIVIKYAVLLGSIVVLARQSWFSSVGAGLGIASFIIPALALAVIYQKREA